jgi:hypothetical protein
MTRDMVEAGCELVFDANDSIPDEEICDECDTPKINGECANCGPKEVDCFTCSGSGEGMADGTRCMTCGGHGTVSEWSRKDDVNDDYDEDYES